ncbi:MAG: hypothetical protein H5T59_04350 [Anaerolineae bacterium]|nr:hypothetical protein [Anaerolineae bacterium]
MSLETFKSILTAVLAALALTLLTAVLCIVGEGTVLYSPRVAAHAVLGTLSAVVLASKVAITHRLRAYLRFNNTLGVAAAVLVLSTFATSALVVLRHRVLGHLAGSGAMRRASRHAAGVTCVAGCQPGAGVGCPAL